MCWFTFEEFIFNETLSRYVYKIFNIYKFGVPMIFIWQIPVRESMIPTCNSLYICQRFREGEEKRRKNKTIFSAFKIFGTKKKKKSLALSDVLLSESNLILPMIITNDRFKKCVYM